MFKFKYSDCFSYSAPPLVKLQTVDEATEEGDEVRIRCITEGQPPPTSIWVFNGHLPLNDDKITINGNFLIRLY